MSVKESYTQPIEKRETVPHENPSNKIDALLTLLVAVSLALAGWGTEIQKETIVKENYLLIAAGTGTLASILVLLKIGKKSINAVWILLCSAVIGGGIAYFLLLFTNRAIPTSTTSTEILPIQQTGNFVKNKKSLCAIPYATIDFKGAEKVLRFGCRYESTIKEFKKVRVDYYTGLFGFIVIKEQTLEH